MDALPRAGTLQTGDQAVAQVKLAVSQQLGWLFRELPGPDLGIDGQIEILADVDGEARPTGRVMSVQVKGGPSFFKSDAGPWTVYIEKPTVHYWRLHSLPVLVVLANLATGECFWTRGDDPALDPTEHHYKIVVPRDQRLDASARAALLNITASAFVPLEDMFRDVLSPESTFTHSRPLAGREDELNTIQAAIKRDTAQVVVVGGRGGIGKSRLLLEAARGAESQGWLVRWAPGDVLIRPEAALDLPPGPVVMVVDDAHRRSDLTTMLRMAAGRREPTKLLVGIRPWGRPGLQSAVRDAMIDSARIVDIGDLTALDNAAVRRLVEEELGPEFRRFARAVVSSLGDSTLVALVGARLLRTQQIPLAFLERDETFHQEVISRFDDAILGELGQHIDGRQAKQLLRLLSVVGPVEIEHSEWLDQAAVFLSIRRSELIELLGDLEAAGILGRRSRRLRVIPDLLSDHLVHRAIVNAVGARTGYEREVLEHFGLAVLVELAANLADLDWRLEEADLPTGAFDDIWRHLVDHFRASNNEHRVEILQALAPVAVMRPKHVIALCAWLRSNPEGDERGRFFRCSNAAVLEKIPPLLEQAAIHPEWFDAATDLLWQLGRDEPEKGYQQHSEVLGRMDGMVSYHPHKPLWVQERALNQVRRWTAEPGWAEHRFTPLGVAEQLLKKEDTLSHREGITIVMTAYPFSAIDSIAIRLATVHLLGKLARSSSARGRLAAVETLLKALEPPTGYFGRDVGADEIERWAGQDLTILDELEQTLQVSADPLVLITVKDRLAWTEYRCVGDVQRRCRAVRTAIPETDLTMLVRAYGHIVPERAPRRGEDISKRVERQRQRKEDLMRKAAAHLRHLHASAAAILSVLADVEAHFTRSRRDANAAELYLELVRPADSLAVSLVEGLARNEQALGHWLSPPLWVLRDMLPEHYRTIACEAVRSEHIAVRRAYGSMLHSLALHGWTPKETEHAIHLLQDDEPLARLVVTKALAEDGVTPDHRLDLLRKVRIDGDVSVAVAFASAAEELFENTDNLPTEEATADLLDRLVEVPRLEGHAYWGVRRFLKTVAERWPHRLASFLVSRLEREAVLNAEIDLLPPRWYSALPDREFDDVWTALQTSDGYGEALRLLRDYTARAKNLWRAVVIFGEFAGANEPTANCLLEWLESGDPFLLDRVPSLIEQLPRTFVVEMPSAVVTMLESAQRAGADKAASVAKALRRAAEHGTGIWEVSELHPSASEMLSAALRLAAGYPDNSLGALFYSRLAKFTRRQLDDESRRDESHEDDPWVPAL